MDKIEEQIKDWKKQGLWWCYEPKDETTHNQEKKMKKKLVFSATLREIRFLLENEYLNERGKTWADRFECEEIKELKTTHNQEKNGK